MKAMLLRRPAAIEGRPLEFAEVAMPEPGPGQLRIRVEACGVCRTDLHTVEGELPPRKQPVVPGHQVVGVVDRLGEGVKGFRVGQRLGIAWLRWTCGECQYCRAGRENLCGLARFTGWDSDGGYAQYAVVDAAYAYRMPEGLEPEVAAPLLCAGIIGYRALKQSEIGPGQRLGIYGFGSSAHLVMEIARFWNCEVYVSTRQRHHQELARSMGAAWVGDGVPSRKLHSAIIFAPAGRLVPRALEALQKGGTLVLAGIYMTAVPELDYEKHLFYERTIRSVTANTRQDGQELLELAGRIPLRPRVRGFPLAQANQALLELKQDRFEGSGVLRVETE